MTKFVCFCGQLFLNKKQKLLSFQIATCNVDGKFGLSGLLPIRLCKKKVMRLDNKHFEKNAKKIFYRVCHK